MSPENKTGKEACHCFIFVDDLLRPGETPEEVIEGLLPPNSVVGLVAPSQSGKSLLALHLASCVSTVRDFLDWTQVISWIRTTCEWSPAEPFGDDSYASFFFAASLRALTPR